MNRAEGTREEQHYSPNIIMPSKCTMDLLVPIITIINNKSTLSIKGVKAMTLSHQKYLTAIIVNFRERETETERKGEKKNFFWTII